MVGCFGVSGVHVLTWCFSQQCEEVYQYDVSIEVHIFIEEADYQISGSI